MTGDDSGQQSRPMGHLSTRWTSPRLQPRFPRLNPLLCDAQRCRRFPIVMVLVPEEVSGLAPLWLCCIKSGTTDRAAANTVTTR